MNFCFRVCCIVCLLSALLLAGCGTFVIEVEQPAGLEAAGTATVGGLLPENALTSTQVAQGAQVTVMTTPDPRLSRASSSEEIRLRLLRGYDLWSNVWVDGRVDDFAPDGLKVVDSRRVQAWVEQKSFQLRLLNGPVDGVPATLKICDGQTLVDFDIRSGHSERQEVPEGVHQPFSAPEADPQAIKPHPFGSLLGPPVSEMLFPTELAQRGGFYLPVREETAAGRRALVVDWMRESGGARIDRLWVDSATGVLLRWQNYSKGGGEALQREVILFRIEFDQNLAAELFKLPISTSPQFSTDYSGTPANTFSSGPGAENQLKTLAASSEPSAAGAQKTGLSSDAKDTLTLSGGSAGMLYFNVVESAQRVRLVRLTADCLLQGTPCPAGQDVAGFPNVNESAVPLAWSPDGKRAVLPSSVGGTDKEPGLYLFDAQTDQWKLMAGGFAFIYPPVSWSPDGRRVVFAAQTSAGREDLYALEMGGQGRLDNLTFKSFPEADFHPALLGWVRERLVFMAVHALKSDLFSLKIDDPKPAPLLAGQLNGKAGLAISPDSSQAAYSDGGTLYACGAGSGACQPRRLASFPGSSVYLLTWAPDNASLAFAVVSTVTDASGGEVYTIRRDGTDLRQIFKGGGVQSVIYSPDGKGIVIGADDGTGRMALFLCELAQGTYRMIQVPGLRLDVPWLGPSWQLSK